MAINLIRKNNSANVTAFHDAAMFHFIKGKNGVIPGVGQQFATSFNPSTKVLTIGSGMGIIYGRQFEIPSGETVEINLTNSPRYITIVVVLDLRDPADEKIEIRAYSGTVTYPNMDSYDDLISNVHGLAYLTLYNINYDGTDIAIVNQYALLANDTIENAKKINRIDIKHNATKNSLEVTVPGSTTQEYVERKKLIYNSISGLQVYAGTVIGLSETISPGDIIEIEYLDDTTNDVHGNILISRFRLKVPSLAGTPNNFILSWLSGGQSSQSGFSAYNAYFTYSGALITCQSKYYKIDISNSNTYTNPNFAIYKIYKIVGGNL